MDGTSESSKQYSDSYNGIRIPLTGEEPIKKIEHGGAMMEYRDRYGPDKFLLPRCARTWS